MATTGIRITLTNVLNGGYVITREQNAGYPTSDWAQRHRQAFGHGQEQMVQEIVHLWLAGHMAENLPDE